MARLCYSSLRFEDPGRTLIHCWQPQASPSRPASVLYLHGLGAYTGWHAAELAELLADYGDFRVISPDMPGYGESAAVAFDDYHPGAIADWTARYLARLTSEPVHIVGHSWGGEIAVHLAERHPACVRSIALLDGGHIAVEPISKDAALQSAREWDANWRFTQVGGFLAALEVDRRRWTPSVASAYERGAIRRDGYYVQRQSPETFAAIKVGCSGTPIETHWDALRDVPVLLAMAADAVEVPPFYPGGMVDMIKDFTWFVVPNCSHFMIEDAAPFLAPKLASWWSGLLESPSISSHHMPGKLGYLSHSAQTR